MGKKENLTMIEACNCSLKNKKAFTVLFWLNYFCFLFSFLIKNRYKLQCFKQEEGNSTVEHTMLIVADHY